MLGRFESRSSRRVLGLFVVLGVIVFLVFAVLRPNPLKHEQTYFAKFDTAQGLGRVDRDVRIAGLNVGKIGDVRRVGDDVVVQLSIDPDIPLHTDALAQLRPHTLFEGSGFVDLEPGSPSAPLLGAGGTIPKSQTRIYVSLDEALRVLHEPTRDQLRDLAGVGAKTLRGHAIEGLQATLRHAPPLFRALGPTARALNGPHGDELAGAISGLSKTVSAVALREADLLPLTQNARRTLAAVNVAAGAPLDASLKALPGVTEELQAGGMRLERVIDRLDSLAVDLRPGVIALAPLLQTLQPVLREATPILRDAYPLAISLGTVIARTSAAAPELHRLLLAIRPGGRILEESVLPFLNSDSRLGLPVYLQLISAFSGATSALRPYQTTAQGPLGSGHVLRLGAYGDLAGITGLPLTLPAGRCSKISLGDPRLAHRLSLLGGCSP